MSEENGTITNNRIVIVGDNAYIESRGGGSPNAYWYLLRVPEQRNNNATDLTDGPDYFNITEA